MRPLIRNRYFLLSDTLLLALAAYSSFVLRLESWDLGRYWIGFILFMLFALLVIPAAFFFSGVYSRYWAYASVNELLLLSVAVAVAVFITNGVHLIGLWIMPGSRIIPLSIPFIFFLLALGATGGPRLLVRKFARSRRHDPSLQQNRPLHVLIVGAGNAGEMILRDLQRNNLLHIEVVGFLDDDTSKCGHHIHGVPVLGTRHDIPRLVKAYGVNQVIIAIASATGKEVREITAICEQIGVQTKIIPAIHELLGGKVTIKQLRDIEIEDLLRREPIQTDTSAVSNLIRGKRVLVTGGGGSIGSELCRQVLAAEPAELIIVGHGENSVFIAQNMLSRLAAEQGVSAKLTAVIADIRFPERIEAIFARYQPQIVFHAAAHKHVPLMEAHPSEAITNNVLGTRNLLEVAQAADVERFVMISTDKAVNPTSIMGTSKRVAELLVHEAACTSGRPYMVVRFGNVLGSRGSVVLTFKQQIANGGPVTVTHPDMRRFFMTIPEAVQLVLQAATLGNGGEVFTLDMGEPVKIADLARDMIELSGLQLGEDIDIVYSGLRPGEKLYEELFVPGEEYRRTSHEKVFIAHNASSFVPANLMQAIAALRVAAQEDDPAAIRLLLQSLVPQFHQPTALPAEPTAVANGAPVSEEQPRQAPRPLARALGGSGGGGR